MEGPHTLLLLLIIGALAVTVSGVALLVKRGAQAARARATALPGSERAPRMVQWQEVTAASSLRRSFFARLRKLFSQLAHGLRRLWQKVMARRRSFLPHIVDPIDGTAFEPGETIVRCACGARYHQHSWRWIGEKNSGKCVNCRRAGMGSTVQLSAA